MKQKNGKSALESSGGLRVELKTKVRFVLSACLALVLLAGCEEPPLLFADGSRGDYDRWNGQWLVVNYWAEWCAPCRVEIPELNELHQIEGVSVVGVNFDGVLGPDLAKSVETMSIEFPVLSADPGPRWEVEQPAILPTTLLVSPAGELVEVRRGPQTLAALLDAMGLAGATDLQGVAELPPTDSDKPSEGS